MSHDPAYKLLFSFPELVADLLRGFVHEDWVEQLDFATLEKVNRSFVSEDLRGREDDVIWRVRWGPEWLYVYLLLEFQSTVERYMAVRILTYVGLLYQDLVRAGQVGAGGRLPPVLPVVLYNGERCWSAPEDIAELVEPAPEELARYRPQLRYLLLDEGRYSEEALSPLKNLVAAVFRLEASRTPQELVRVLDTLLIWLAAPEQDALRRAFAVWLKRVLLPRRMPGTVLPEVVELQEIKTMLAERVKEWTKQWVEQGLQQGRQEGRREGEAALLLRLLEHKFGGLSEEVRERVARADAQTLLLWGERILTAKTVDEVLGEQGTSS